MNYHNITTCDMKNGDGLRVVLWVSGCIHHCDKCQNPQTWNPKSGILFDRVAEAELFNELEKDYISGITFSGGDPLCYDYSNYDTVTGLIRRIREIYTPKEKDIWVYTGYTMGHLINVNKVPDADVIIDGTYMNNLRDTTIPWRGSTNQHIFRRIDNNTISDNDLTYFSLYDGTKINNLSHTADIMNHKDIFFLKCDM